MQACLSGTCLVSSVVYLVENRQTWELANPAWYPQPTIATTDIQEAAVAGLATSWHQKSMEA